MSSTILLTAVPTSAEAEAPPPLEPCERSGGGSIDDVGAEGTSRRRCPGGGGGGGATQADLWGWFCRRHGAYIDGVTEVVYDTNATFAEYVNEAPVPLQFNLTPDQFEAMRTLTYHRRSCVINNATVYTIVYPVDNDGNSIDDLVQMARARVEPPTPSITRLPSLDGGNAVVVQNPLWVWTTDPVTETATAGNGVQVSVTSQLQDMTFTLTGSDYNEQWTCDPTQVQVSGDGLSLDQYRQPNNYNACHIYIERSSTGEPNNTFTLTATATWTFTYRINGSSPFLIPGTVTRSNSYPVDAVEILVVND